MFIVLAIGFMMGWLANTLLQYKDWFMEKQSSDVENLERGEGVAESVVITKKEHEKEAPVGIITERVIRAGQTHVSDTLAPVL